MIVIVNHTEGSKTVAFEPVPRDRLSLLLIAYCRLYEGHELTISYPGRSADQIRGKTNDADFYLKLDQLFRPILQPSI